MYIPYKIGSKDFLLKPYTSKQEKEILLLSSFGIDDLERIFELLEFKSKYNIQDLSLDEQKVLLYKFRDISLGDEVEVKFTCENCSTPNENMLEATNFIIPSIREDEDVQKINKPVTDDNLHEFVPGIDIDELDINEFESLKQRVKENQIGFDFIKTTRCMKCGHEKEYSLSDPKWIISIMSDDELMTLYKTYNFLIFFGHYTKEDIDNMMPFERSIFTGLLSKTKEELSQ